MTQTVKGEDNMSFILEIIHDLTQVHPPHPMFVHFPIALTGAALFFIILAMWKRSKIMEQAAFANMNLAAVGTIFAAAFGIRDNLVRYGGGAPNHTAKIILAIIVFSITTTVTIARWRNKDLFYNRATKGLYTAAYFVCFPLTIVLSFLGGVILYGF
jgi:uncharacterized membrane protein